MRAKIKSDDSSSQWISGSSHDSSGVPTRIPFGLWHSPLLNHMGDEWEIGEHAASPGRAHQAMSSDRASSPRQPSCRRPVSPQHPGGEPTHGSDGTQSLCSLRCLLSHAAALTLRNHHHAVDDRPSPSPPAPRRPATVALPLVPLATPMHWAGCAMLQRAMGCPL